MAKKKLKLGTRNSRLALWQAEAVASELRVKFDLEIEIIPIISSGDKTEKSLLDIGGKGLFIKELDEQLVENKVDLCVHSAKDLPAQITEGIAVYSVLKRGKIGDLLLTTDNLKLAQLALNSVIGTCSIRRKNQLLQYNPQFIIKDLRGNIDRRIAKLQAGHYDAIIVAEAALDRLQISAGELLDRQIMPPALGQGCIVVSLLSSDLYIANMIRQLQDATNELIFKCERAFLKTLNADCTTPLAGLVKINNQQMELQVYLYQGGKNFSFSNQSPIAKLYELGSNLAMQVISTGLFK